MTTSQLTERGTRDILFALDIAAPPERVYEALTTRSGLASWWTRDAAIEPQIGAAGTFGFYGRRFVMDLRVTALAAPAHVAWAFDSPTFAGTTATFDLTPNGSGTSLLFAHRGFTDDERMASANTRWGYYMISLKRALEHGTGTPNPDDTDL
jgi:uncharacterized protein YndB with AHSA1/START domain